MSNLSYEQRKKYGEQAEKHFKEMCKQKNIFFKSFGIENANYSLQNHYHLDYRLQCQPDYIIYYQIRSGKG